MNQTVQKWILSLRICIASFGLLFGLISCGGGLPGTGGTGITASSPVFSSGNISGFGSVIVNGVRFDDQTAVVKLDGVAQTASQLRLGMVAQVTGALSSNTPTQAKADIIDVWAIAQGAASPATTTSFSVAGMTITTNAATVLEGLSATASLRSGDSVKVWGFATNAAYSSWIATRVELSSASSNNLITSGLIPAGGFASLNGYSLTGTVPSLGSGTAVTLVGVATGKSLNVRTSHVLSDTGQQGLVEREGVITSAIVSGRFSLGATTVEIGTATLLPVGSLLAQGQRVEVEGIWNGSLLKASKIIIKSEAEQQEVEIDAVIEQFVSTADFTVRGQRCDASALTVVNGGTLADLRVGLRVHLQGRKSGDKVRVTELEIVR